MSELMVQKKVSGKWSAGVLGLGVMVSMTLASLAGCDTVARISFQDNEFTGVRTAGIVAPESGACKGSSGPAVLRLVPLSTNGAVHEGMVLGTQEVQFSQDALTFSERALFSLPNEECSGTCEQGNFSCGFSNGSFESNAELKRCHLPDVGVSVTGAPRFVSKLNANQLFGVLMENTGSLEGKLPSSITTAFPDYQSTDGTATPDGKGDTNLVLQSSNMLRATDNSSRRKSALGVMRANWERVAEYAVNEFKTRTLFGLWTFENSRASINSLIGTETQWAESPGVVQGAINNYPSSTNATQASVFEAISTLLTSESAYAGMKYDGYEKVLVVFVDGPDELRLANVNAQRVIDEAAGAGDVRIFVVHLDSSVALVAADGRTPTFVDDPKYVESQDGFDSADNCGCKNFEECRQVTRYSDSVQTAADFLPPGEKNEKFFCVPKRDANGRIGPIDDYAQIACATGGGYIYVPEPEALPNQLDWLPRVLDGLWEVPVNVDAFSRGTVEAGQAYQLQMNMTLTLDQTGRPFSFSQQGEFRNADTRAVVFAEE